MLHVWRDSIWRLNILKIAITVLQLLCGLGIILIVLFQSGKSAGLSGAIGGVADSFLAKNKAKTMDAKLARATKWIGALFLILTMVLLILG
jgi:preprotein translocase subunit SecG